MPTVPISARHDLTNAEWDLLQPPLPAASPTGRPRIWGLRSLVNGIFFRVRTGCPWRDVPERYGPWWRVYHLFVRLRADGVWQDVHTRLLAQDQHTGQLSWEVSVDFTTTLGTYGSGHNRTAPPGAVIIFDVQLQGYSSLLSGGRARQTPSLQWY
ncbi:transposase [Corynebacterium glutamicum]|uniref:transposase n=1 Tax=Corynebacterium glutamicum TaxID=1718 RepID=UPI00117D3624|nr:transposase [Corynebacterium glutamicum]QDQ19971.1 transposase [Corynebacterium glutamicum]QDQ23538.1 transposase [Corynebacterium glutamicum]